MESTIEIKFGKVRYNIEFLEETLFHNKGEKFENCLLESIDGRKPELSSEWCFSDAEEGYTNFEDIPDENICTVFSADYKVGKVKIEFAHD